VVRLRNEDRHPLDVTIEAKVAIHFKTIGDLAHGAFQGRRVDAGPTFANREIEANSLEEFPGLQIRVLVGVEDIQAEGIEKL